LSGVASGGALRRPHVVFSEELSKDEREAVEATFPGSGDKTVSINPDNWQLITDAMAQTTLTGTAAAAHLEGIDFIGKTGTAQVMSHDALARSGGGHKTDPNAWFVGMAPRRNPDIVVAVLWEHGNWGNNSAKLAAQVIDAYVNKRRKQENNIRIAAVPSPVAKPETISVAAPRAAGASAVVN
jgi:penicillin-binding protein 2